MHVGVYYILCSPNTITHVFVSVFDVVLFAAAVVRVVAIFVSLDAVGTPLFACGA